MKDHPSQWIAGRLTCRDVTDRTTDYLSDRLPLLKRIRVGLHVVSCADCRAYAKQIVLVRDALALLPKRFPSPVNRLRLRQCFAAAHSH